MTTFFVPGVESRGERAEKAYRALRERSQLAAGCPARSRRIFRLSCRRGGRDQEIEVGRPLDQGSEVVVAIIDHGRDAPFLVHTAVGEAATPLRVSRPVYSVTEFT